MATNFADLLARIQQGGIPREQRSVGQPTIFGLGPSFPNFGPPSNIQPVVLPPTEAFNAGVDLTTRTIRENILNNFPDNGGESFSDEQQTEPDVPDLPGTAENFGNLGKSMFNVLTSIPLGFIPALGMGIADPNTPSFPSLADALAAARDSLFGGTPDVGFDFGSTDLDEGDDFGEGVGGFGEGVDESTDESFGTEDEEGNISGGGSSDTQQGGNDEDDADDSVICSKLYKMGCLDRVIYEYDQAYGQTMSCTVVVGYHYWAKPLTRLMDKKGVAFWIAYLLGRSWAQECAHLAGAQVASPILGRWLHKIGVPMCRMIGKFVLWKSTAYSLKN